MVDSYQFNQNVQISLDSLYFVIGFILILLQTNKDKQYKTNAHMNNRFLNYSPTAATLHPDYSNPTLSQLPPLVSISQQPPLQFSNMDPTPSSRRVQQIQKKQLSPKKSIKSIQATNINTKQYYTTKSRANKVALPYAHFPVKYGVQAKQIVEDNQFREAKDRDDSVAESVYLDLEEYSSIHKYQSISPYYEEDFDEDKEYAKYLGADGAYLQPKSSVKDIRINLQAQQSIIRSRMNNKAQLPQLVVLEQPPQLSDDTYPYSQLINSASSKPQIRRSQSNQQRIGEKNPKDMVIVKHPVSDVIRQDDENNNFHESDAGILNANSARFVRIEDGQSYTLPQKKSRYKGIIASITEQAYHLLPNPLPTLTSLQTLHQSPSSWTSQLLDIQPQWFKKAESQDNLRVILTRKNKLLQYMKYIAQLQILLQSYEKFRNVDVVCDRGDVVEKGLRDQGFRGNVTVYYDVDEHHNLKINNAVNMNILSNVKRDKEEKKQIRKQQISANSAKLPQTILLPTSTLSQTGRLSSKSRENSSEYISSLNVFTSAGRLKSKAIPQAISQTNEDLYMDFNDSQTNKNYRDVQKSKIRDNKNSSGYDSSSKRGKFTGFIGKGKTHEVQVMRLIEVILIKLADKKCDVRIKNQKDKKADDCDTLSSASRMRFQNKRNKQNSIQQYYISKGLSPLYLQQKVERIDISFDEYLRLPSSQKSQSSSPSKNATGSLKITSQAEKLKNLIQTMQKKDKYLEEIRTQYDCIINNYITTIANLKNLKVNEADPNIFAYKPQDMLSSRVHRLKEFQEDQENQRKVKDHQRKGVEDQIENFRMSQPMTFQMSKNGNQSILEEDHWIGNPNANMEGYISNIRHSLPQKN